MTIECSGRQFIDLVGARNPIGRDVNEAGAAQTDSDLTDAASASHQLIAKDEARGTLGSDDSDAGAAQSDEDRPRIMSTKDTSPVHGQGVPASRPTEPNSWPLLHTGGQGAPAAGHHRWLLRHPDGQDVPYSRLAEPRSWLLISPEQRPLLHPDGVTLVFELPGPPEDAPTAESPRPSVGAPTAEYSVRQLIAPDGARGIMGCVQ